MATVSALFPGTPKWAEVIAIRLVATKYAGEVEAIKTELMFAYAQGYQDAGRDSMSTTPSDSRKEGS